MIYDVADITGDVRIALDSFPSRSLLDVEDTDAVSIDAVIRSKIEDSVRTVEMEAPVYMLDGGRSFDGPVTWSGNRKGEGSGFIVLPRDFMRLVVFQMSDWNMPVTEAITEESPMYALQKSRFAGIRGCPEKPVAAIVQYPVGKVLEFYSCTGGGHVFTKYSRYIPYPYIKDDTVEICEKLYRSVVHHCAALTGMTLGENDIAQQLLTISKELAK